MSDSIEKIVVTPKVLELFGGTARIIDRRYWIGLRRIDKDILKQLQSRLPEVFNNKEISSSYDVAVVSTTRVYSKDFKDLGIKEFAPRYKELHNVRGIPVPWYLLKKAGFDYNKINVVLVPKATM